MNIYDDYPERVICEGKVYALNFSYDRVLRCIDIQKEPLLTMRDKVDAQAELIIDHPPRDFAQRVKVLNAALQLIPKGDGENSERLIDFHQDAKMIRTAFFRIGVDLLKDKIHFLQFLELLGDLPKDTALMRTVEIRAKPLPKPNEHNREYIAELQKAKARVAIRMGDDEAREKFMQALKNSSIGRG